MSSFVDSLNTFEQSTLRVGLDSKHSFTPEVQSKLVAIVSRFGGRQLPTTSNLHDIVVQLARYQLIVKPMPASLAIHAGIPNFERPFWADKSLADVYMLYTSMFATPEKVISMIEEPESMNPVQGRSQDFINGGAKITVTRA